MCECLKRADGTWHVDTCCAEVMDEYHAGRGKLLPNTAPVKAIFDELLLRWAKNESKGFPTDSSLTRHYASIGLDFAADNYRARFKAALEDLWNSKPEETESTS